MNNINNQQTINKLSNWSNYFPLDIDGTIEKWFQKNNHFETNI